MDIVTELLRRGVDVNAATNVTLLFLCYFYAYCASVLCVICAIMKQDILRCVEFVVLSFSRVCSMSYAWIFVKFVSSNNDVRFSSRMLRG